MANMISLCAVSPAAAAAAAVCDTGVTEEFPVRTESRRVAPTRGRRAAAQLNRGGEVVVPLLWGILAASAPECVGRNRFATDWVHRRIDDVVV